MNQRSPEQRLALLELENAWDKERQQYLIYRRRGYSIDPRGAEPQDRTGITWAAIVIYAVAVIAPLFTEYDFGSWMMLIFGAGLFVPGIVSGFSETTKSQEYTEAKARFEEKRARILDGE